VGSPLTLFAFTAIFFENFQSWEEAARRQRVEASCTQNSDEAVKQRSIKSIKKREHREELKRTKCFAHHPPTHTPQPSSIHLFIQPCFAIQAGRQEAKRKREKTELIKLPFIR
jgi:hypothetical protein